MHEGNAFKKTNALKSVLLITLIYLNAIESIFFIKKLFKLELYHYEES